MRNDFNKIKMLESFLSTHNALLGEPMFWLIFYFDILCTVLTFIISIYFNNSSIYDPYWSVFPPIALILLCFDYFISDRVLSGMYLKMCGFGEYHDDSLQRGTFSWLFIVIFVCLSAWAYRLTRNFFTRPEKDDSAGNILTKGQEDWRYRALRLQGIDFLKRIGIQLPTNSRWNIPYWIISFFGIHLFPTLMVFFAMVPLFALIFNSNQINSSEISWLQLTMFALSTVLSLLCVLISHLADNTLHKHLATRTDNKQVLVDGVWAYTRHGNYAGEVGFWWSIYFFALSLDLVYVNFIWCPIIISCLFQFISVPWVERKMAETKPLYSLYQQQVSVMIPWFHSNDFSLHKYK